MALFEIGVLWEDFEQAFKKYSKLKILVDYIILLEWAVQELLLHQTTIEY